jgi:hypothetical protein
VGFEPATSKFDVTAAILVLVAGRARAADLIVLGRKSPQWPRNTPNPGDVLMTAGGPVLSRPRIL